MMLEYLKLKSIAICLIILISIPINSYGKKYINLPIASYGVKNSTLTLVIEEDVLVPSLTNLKVNENNLFSILPFKGSANASIIEKSIKAQSGISLGHAMPYLYIAINHAFNRIYYNSIIQPRESEDSLRKSMGFTADLKIDGLENIRDILSIREIENQKLTVEVYSNLTSLRKAQSNLKFISDEAFWDPEKHRIGLYINLGLFRWLPSQVSWGNQTNEEAITAVRNYVSKRLIQTICHELVHFIHYVSGSKTYNIPFLAEGSAIFLEENIDFREDLFQIAGALIARNIFESNLPSSNSPCNELNKLSPPFSGLAMTKIENGLKGLSKSKTNLEELIVLNEKEFYSRSLRGFLNLSD